ncbi:MAG: hypothetical protein LBT81_00595 [Helicobacteraceae bacterium]|jgi:hypothetical protein|nr:hypothetical protein [Helicobacteraceae bacterium]
MKEIKTNKRAQGKRAMPRVNTKKEYEYVGQSRKEASIVLLSSVFG